MNMRKIILFLLLILCARVVQAQKNIVLEKMRCFSATGITMNYFKDEAIRKTIAAQLSKTLLQHHHLSLTDTSTLPNIEYLNSVGNLPPVDLAFTRDDSRLHLYIDLFEIEPSTFFAYPDNIPGDTTIKERAKSVFLIKGSLINSDKTIAFSEQLNVVVSAAETQSMGIVYRYFGGDGRLRQIVTPPKAFMELFKAATNILFNPANQLEMVEIKASPAYFAENFIIPNIFNQPKIFVSTIKNISTYNYAGSAEMIRLGPALYEEVMLKGKNPQKYPNDITTAIKNTAHYAGSDFVFLRQDCRDVIRDKNYLLKLTTQVDPENMQMAPFTFTNFLTGKFHYLFQEKDTIARFNILKRIPDESKKLYPNRISNGNDTSFFTVSTANPEARVTYDYVATGTIGNQNFTIKCSGFTNTVKEIYLGNKLICIAQGKFSPEKFVVFDASLSPELLNQLFMIGFNRFFE
ncbi:MAG: hypothetical protein JWQ30_1965 [Sediminibacterium sp.]|nr:hypothetical protein [Sediminibacterium sp.]